MTIQILMTLSASAGEPSMRHLGLVLYVALAEKFVVPSVGAKPSGLGRDLLVASGAQMPKRLCESCKEDRAKKVPPLPPMEAVKLPMIATSEGFRQPKIPTIVCPYCDGDSLVSSAIRNCKARQEPQA